jgi:outer membrane protein OmpA-like peptidoglycan-associated protein
MNKYIIFFSLAFSTGCFAEYFEVPLLKANWTVETSKTSCQLKQDIPLYGRAEFIHRSGNTLQFSIQEQRPKPQVIKASLSAMPSPWQQQISVSPHDYQVFLDQSSDIRSYGKLAVYGKTAETMIDVLLQGQSPTFTYVRAAADLDVVETRVAVSAIKFFEPYESFIDCRKRMLPFGIRDLQDAVVYFNPGSKTLNHVAKQQVNKIASYLKEIKKGKVVLGSETAVMGKADKKWFSRRSASLIKVLTKQGISKDRIKVQGNFAGAQDHNTIRLHIFGPDALKWVFYRKGNINLTGVEKKRLKLLVKYVQSYYRSGSLVINSHTDSLGSKSSNKKVSRKRGNVIKRYLESQGVSKNQILVKAFGESRPIKSNRTPKGRSKNRRVEISFSG